MIKIEVLFPEVCNLCGDLFNIKYLKNCIEECEVLETNLTDEPRFISDKDIKLIYMGPMSEKTQILVIEKLKKYKDIINKLIENNIIFLVTRKCFRSV